MENEERAEEKSITVVQGGILKADNEAQQSWAKMNKRSIKEATNNSIAELEAFPDFAYRAWYSIPYRDEKVAGGITKVEGPSIKAATALMRNWKNCTSGALIVGETDERVQILGFFFDVENNIRKFKPNNISKMAWSKKDQKTYRLADHKLVMAIQAGASKAERNAILSGLPQGLIELYVDTAKRIAASGKKSDSKAIVEAPKDRIAKMYKAFEKLGVPAEKLDDYLDLRADELDTSEKIIVEMTGLYTAIKDKQMDPGEIFGLDKKADKIEGQTTIDDVIRQAPV